MVIAIIEDIITNVALVIVGYLLNACIRFMVGWDSREAFNKLKKTDTENSLPKGGVSSSKELCEPRGKQRG